MVKKNKNTRKILGLNKNLFIKKIKMQYKMSENIKSL